MAGKNREIDAFLEDGDALRQGVASFPFMQVYFVGHVDNSYY
jgi:hypothetical protein